MRGRAFYIDVRDLWETGDISGSYNLCNYDNDSRDTETSDSIGLSELLMGIVP